MTFQGTFSDKPSYFEYHIEIGDERWYYQHRSEVWPCFLSSSEAAHEYPAQLFWCLDKLLSLDAAHGLTKGVLYHKFLISFWGI